MASLLEHVRAIPDTVAPAACPHSRGRAREGLPHPSSRDGSSSSRTGFGRTRVGPVTSLDKTGSLVRRLCNVPSKRPCPMRCTSCSYYTSARGTINNRYNPLKQWSMEEATMPIDTAARRSDRRRRRTHPHASRTPCGLIAYKFSRAFQMRKNEKGKAGTARCAVCVVRCESMEVDTARCVDEGRRSIPLFVASACWRRQSRRLRTAAQQ